VQISNRANKTISLVLAPKQQLATTTVVVCVPSEDDWEICPAHLLGFIILACALCSCGEQNQQHASSFFQDQWLIPKDDRHVGEWGNWPTWVHQGCIQQASDLQAVCVWCLSSVSQQVENGSRLAIALQHCTFAKLWVGYLISLLWFYFNALNVRIFLLLADGLPVAGMLSPPPLAPADQAGDALGPSIANASPPTMGWRQ
jgi:hypothetical protein